MATKKTRGRPRAGETPLSRWLDENGMTRKEFARRLEISTEYLHRLCRMARRPSLELALRIEKATAGSVPASFWTAVPTHSRDD